MFSRAKAWLSRRRLENTPCYERTAYTFDGAVLRAIDPLGSDESLALSDIVEIGIETTCLGPFAEDVFWLVRDEKRSIQVPQCSPVFKQLLDRFRLFDHFDWESFGRHVTCTDDAYFLCWKRA